MEALYFLEVISMNTRKRMIKRVKRMIDNSAIVVKVRCRNKRTYTMDSLKEAFENFNKKVLKL